MNKHYCFATQENSTEAVSLSSFVDSLPWPVITIGDDGRVLRLSRPIPGKLAPADISGQSYFAHLFPEFFFELGGEECWRLEQQADLTRQTPEGMVRERIFLRRFSQGFSLIVVDQAGQSAPDTPNLQTARLAALGFMVAGVCHEVSNPVASIHSMVQILQSEKKIAPARLEKGLANIANNVRRLLDISRRLLCFGRVGEEPRCVFPVDTLIEEAFAIATQGRNIERIELQIDAETDTRTVGSSIQLQEVFVNIFENACQAMNGEGALHVTIRRRNAERIIVEVRDNGPGFARDVLPRLFEPFFTTKASGHGSGLGLAICSEILFEHDSSITAENNAEGGACFRIDLPLHKESAKGNA